MLCECYVQITAKREHRFSAFNVTDSIVDCLKLNRAVKGTFLFELSRRNGYNRSTTFVPFCLLEQSKAKSRYLVRNSMHKEQQIYLIKPFFIIYSNLDVDVRSVVRQVSKNEVVANISNIRKISTKER